MPADVSTIWVVLGHLWENPGRPANWRGPSRISRLALVRATCRPAWRQHHEKRSPMWRTGSSDDRGNPSRSRDFVLRPHPGYALSSFGGVIYEQKVTYEI